MRNMKGLFGAAAIVAGMTAMPAVALDMGATDKAIKLAINEWTGQHLSTRVAGGILERAATRSNMLPQAIPQFIALGAAIPCHHGDLDIERTRPVQ